MRNIGERGLVRTRAADNRGFTLVELLTVMVLISILAAIAEPSLRRAVTKARAADAVADMNVVRLAVLTFQADNDNWPRSQGKGRVPPDLEDYLPDGFSFTTPDYTLSYEDWSKNKKKAFDIGITLTTDDQELGLSVLNMLGNSMWTDGKKKFTWIIEG